MKTAGGGIHDLDMDDENALQNCKSTLKIELSLQNNLPGYKSHFVARCQWVVSVVKLICHSTVSI